MIYDPNHEGSNTDYAQYKAAGEARREIKVAEKPACGDEREFEIGDRVTVINTQNIGDGYTGTVTEKNMWLHDPRNNLKWYHYRVAFPPYTLGGIIYPPANLIPANANPGDALAAALARIAELEAERDALLDYVKAGQYGNGEEVSACDEIGLELFNVTRGLMADASAGHFLSGELDRLEAALKPFANAAEDMNVVSCGDRPALLIQRETDTGVIHVGIRIYDDQGNSELLVVRHLRAAADALKDDQP